MTKEEVLEKLEEERESAKSKILYGQARNLSVKRYGWYFNGMNYAIALVEKLDKPEKVVIPQFVADWIEEYSKDFAPLGIVYQILNRSLEKDVQNHWRNDEGNQKLLLNAVANGYEVEKEPKYRVKLPGMIGDNGQQYISKSMDDKLFACAYRDYLEQEFTKEELEKFPNWVQQLEFEEVEN